MRKENVSIRIQKENEAVDELLNRFGEDWTNAASRSEDAFASRFEKVLRRASSPKKAEVVTPRPWKLNASFGLAAAACLAGILFFIWRPDGLVGSVVFHEGGFQVAGRAPLSGKIGSGDLIETDNGGVAMLSIDNNRINLFLNDRTSLTVASAETILLKEGEIWVSVEKDSGFFEVETPHGFVQVHGTTFGVEVSPSGTEVDIAAGRVSVGGRERSRFITPGTGARITFENPDPALSPSEEDVTPEWAENLFYRAAAHRAGRYFPSANLR